MRHSVAISKARSKSRYTSRRRSVNKPIQRRPIKRYNPTPFELDSDLDIKSDSSGNSPISPSSSSSSDSSMSPRPPIATMEHRFSEFFIHEYFRYSVPDDQTHTIDLAESLKWTELLKLEKSILKKVIDNAHPDYKHLEIYATLANDNVLRPRRTINIYIYPELSNDIRNYYSNYLDFLVYTKDNNIREFYRYWRTLPHVDIANSIRKRNIQSYDVGNHIITPFLRITKTYLPYIVTREDIENIVDSMYTHDFNKLNRQQMKYVLEVLKLTAPIFSIGVADDNTPQFTYYDIVPIDKRNPIYYSYLIYHATDEVTHNTSFIINNIEKVIYLFDTGSGLNITSKEQLLYIRNMYKINYDGVIVNNSKRDLQHRADIYTDVYCQAWAMLFLYAILIKKLTIDEFRRVYISPIPNIRDLPDINEAMTEELRGTIERYKTGFLQEIKSFLLDTLNIIAPKNPTEREEFYRNLHAILLDKDFNRFKANLAIISNNVPAITTKSAYH